MVFLCCSSTDGPTLGRKCLINMATKLSKFIVDITGFLPPESILNLPATILQILKTRTREDVAKEKKSSGPLMNLQKRLHFSKTFSDSIIDSTVCWLKRKRKATLYFTPLHLLVFSWTIVQSTQVRNFFVFFVPHNDLETPNNFLTLNLNPIDKNC